MASAPLEISEEAAPVAAAPPLPSLRGHVPALDGVRGLAILLVLLLHFVSNTRATNSFEAVVGKAFAYGLYGVDLFFVLSGFLITGILYDARQKPHYFRNFYARRFLRIFPLYYGVLAILFFVLPLVPAFRGPALQELRSHQAWAWLYGINFYVAGKGTWTGALPYIDHFWSLAVEEHFYFVWPLVVWFLAKRPRLLLGVSFGLSAGAMIARVVAEAAGVPTVTAAVLTPFRLDGLAMGGFLAVLARQPGGPATIVRWFPRVAAAAAVCLASIVTWSHVSEAGASVLRPMRASFILLLLATLLLWAVAAPKQTLVSRVFTSAPMVFLGTYSYGLYVYHHFLAYYFNSHGTEFVVQRWVGSHTVAVALQATAGIGLSIAVAYLSYQLVEKQFLKLKGHFESSR